jgi:pimeloyl-ACP methyl ester carboxylesterase
MPPTNVRLIEVDDHTFRTRIKLGERPPLLIFNGIGANLELLEPLTDALAGIETIVFELPGMGETPPSIFPYRMRHLARSIARMLDDLGYSGQVDVLGVSWGGALAQQFAFTCGRRCRKLILGACLFSGGLSAIAG